MKVFSYCLLVLSLSSGLAQCSVNDDELIDPLDMLNYDRSTVSMRRPRVPETSRNGEPVHNDRCTVFISRFINILIKNTGLSSKEENHEELKSYTSVKMSAQDLQLLKNMAINRDIDYIEIDRILNNMFTPMKKSASGYQATKNFGGISHVEIKEVLFWITVGSVLLVILYVLLKHIRFVFSLTFILCFIFILAFASTWYSMYMKAVINRNVHLEYMPVHCQQRTGGWLSSSWFGRNDIDECKKYREAIVLNPIYSIAITEVFTEMLSKMMVKPIETLGESIYGFNKSVFKDFPYWAQIIIVPIIIAIIIKSLLLAIALLVGRSLSMKSVFGYGGTSIGSGPTNNEQLNANNRTNYNTHPTTHPTTSVQPTVAHVPQMPKVNFNINLFHHNQTVENSKVMSKNTSFLIKNGLKANRNNPNYLIEMLKNKEIDSVDSNDCGSLTVEKHIRHRTLSI